MSKKDGQKGAATPERERGGQAQGASEETLIAVRRDKAARVRERGGNPFANDVTTGTALTELGPLRAGFAAALDERGRYDAAQVEARSFRVAGRVLFVRSMGGVTFMRLRDRTGELQLYCDQARMGGAYDQLDDVDLGDFVEAEGTTMATQRGELSVNADRLRLLSKALRPPPTKTSFRDVESRYRMRYVDLVANPPVAEVFRARSVLVSALRGFLDARGFLEVETPTLHPLIGGAAARPFVTHHNTLDLELYLRIAPELYLKRLVVGGFERVYEIARCFRNEGVSTRHNPEFSMLEYYQAYATYETLMDQTEEMFRAADARLAEALPAAHAAWAATRSFTLERFERVTMVDAIHAALDRAGLPWEVVDEIGGERPDIKAWAKLAKEHGRDIDWTSFRTYGKRAASPGERIFYAYEHVAEPFLTADYRKGERSVPVFIVDFPVEVSPLARRKDSDPRFADRFELFVGGQELCNAFSELNDPDDQAARFQAQVDKKRSGEEETMDFDTDYVRALEFGMPPTAGFGMGVDRFVMALTASLSIRDVILFPLLRPESGGGRGAPAGGAPA